MNLSTKQKLSERKDLCLQGRVERDWDGLGFCGQQIKITAFRMDKQ